MSLNNRIKERREALNMSRAELANSIGVTPSAIANYENGISSPKIELLYKLFKALKCDANYLYQDEIKEFTTETPTSDELTIIKKYRSLSDYDKGAVDSLINHLSGRQTEFIQIESPTLLPYYGRIASAGTGQFVFDDIPPEMIEVESNHINMQADFAVGVNGDSMEPTYKDRDVLLIKKQPSVNIGEIGIFMIDGEAFVKELGHNVLVSHNPKYAPIPFSESISCIGKVLGKV